MAIKTFLRTQYVDGKDYDIIINLAEVRKLAGFTQSELAAMVGVSKNTISSVENHDLYPNSDLLIRLCIALKCPVYLLVYVYDIHSSHRYTGL